MPTQSPLRREPRVPPACTVLLAALALLAGCSSGSETTATGAGDHALTAPAMAPGADQPHSAHVGIVGEGADRGKAELRSTAEMAAAPPAGPADAQVQGDPLAALPGATAMLIRTGHASVEVDALDRALAAVQALAQRAGGFVANSEIQTGRDRVRTASVEIRVPSAQFDLLLAGLDPLGRIESVNTASQDVGEEYTDLNARVENARRLEERLIALLATRTGRLEDVLTVERELARVREQIERMEGRMRYLRERAAMSTLRLQLHEPVPLVNAPGHNPIAQAFRQSWRNFVEVMAGLIAVAGAVVPLAVLTGLAWLVARRWLRRPAAPPAAPGTSGAS